MSSPSELTVNSDGMLLARTVFPRHLPRKHCHFGCDIIDASSEPHRARIPW
jgi:hypothetical protein